jgi:hypothetical protein
MEEYDPLVQNNTHFFSTSAPTPIFIDLKALVADASPSVSSTSWKMKFTLNLEKVGQIEVVVNLLRVDDSTICLEFSRKRGNQLAFFEFFKKTKQSLNLYNDATFVV